MTRLGKHCWPIATSPRFRPRGCASSAACSGVRGRRSPTATSLDTGYEQAIALVPDYTRARVHLAELLVLDGDLAQAESLLGPSLMASDPEGAWRLADVLAARGNREDANRLRLAAKTRYERLLGNYELAFADHAAEFYLGIGNEPARALALARRNLANRATARAFALAYTAAVRAGDQTYANALDRQFAQMAKGTSGRHVPK